VDGILDVMQINCKCGIITVGANCVRPLRAHNTATILKSEMYYLRKFTSRDDLISAIERYLYFYINKRYQQRLKCMTPMKFLIKCFCFFTVYLTGGTSFLCESRFSPCFFI
jgi:hypothetical protein